MSYRKIGGLHWISIGRMRISFCVKKATTGIPANLMPRQLNGLQAGCVRHAFTGSPVW
jgi:hypothetical protein